MLKNPSLNQSSNFKQTRIQVFHINNEFNEVFTRLRIMSLKRSRRMSDLTLLESEYIRNQRIKKDENNINEAMIIRRESPIYKVTPFYMNSINSLQEITSMIENIELKDIKNRKKLIKTEKKYHTIIERNLPEYDSEEKLAEDYEICLSSMSTHSSQLYFDCNENENEMIETNETNELIELIELIDYD